jgi:hypothetical protein
MGYWDLISLPVAATKAAAKLYEEGTEFLGGVSKAGKRIIDPPTVASGEPPEEQTVTFAPTQLETTEPAKTAGGIPEMDPNLMGALQWLQQQVHTGEYEEDLRRMAQKKLMKGQELGQQIGQTTQAMGSRGAGRVAQIQRASELDLQAQYADEIVKAKESATAAGIEASKAIAGIVQTNIDQYTAMHGLSMDERTMLMNEGNNLTQGLLNVMNSLITNGNLDTPEAMKKFGQFQAQAWRDFFAETTPEGRARVAAEYAALASGDLSFWAV